MFFNIQFEDVISWLGQYWWCLVLYTAVVIAGFLLFARWSETAANIFIFTVGLPFGLILFLFGMALSIKDSYYRHLLTKLYKIEYMWESKIFHTKVITKKLYEEGQYLKTLFSQQETARKDMDIKGEKDATTSIRYFKNKLEYMIKVARACGYEITEEPSTYWSSRKEQ